MAKKKDPPVAKATNAAATTPAETPEDPSHASAPEIPDAGAIDPALEQNVEATQGETASAPEPEDRIQILDLQNSNPIVSYRNQIFSCEWTSTIGTDIILTAPDPNFPHPILRQGQGVSVLSATNVNLKGRPVQLALRSNTNFDEALENSTKVISEASNLTSDLPNTDQTTPVKIPLGSAPSRARQNQASFLERLMAIKASKGEKDNVTVYTQKVNQGTGWRNQQRARADMIEGEGDAEENTPAMKRMSLRERGATVGRPRGSRKRAGARTRKGGLFRDYRPQLWDTEGADIRGQQILTPERWNQIEGDRGDGRLSSTNITARTSATPAQQIDPSLEDNRPTGPGTMDARPETQTLAMTSNVKDISENPVVAGNDPNSGPTATADVEMEDA